MTDREPDLPDYICSSLSGALSQAGIDPDTARVIVQIVGDDVRREFGGERHYVRQSSKEQRKQRNGDIVRAWKAGKGREDIAAGCDVDRRTVDRVIDAHLSKAARKSTGFGRKEWVL